MARTLKERLDQLERVRRLAEAARRAQEATADTVAARDAAIIEAADGWGYSHVALAKVTGLNRSRIEQILANRSAEWKGGPRR